MTYALIQKAIEPGKLSAKVRAAVDAELAAGRYVVQPKYDGVNGVLDVGMREGDPLLRTRTGELVPSCQHIEQAAKALPPGRYFGEIWQARTPHAVINGMARQHGPAPDLVFVAFDHITPEEVRGGGTAVPYSTRLRALEDVLDDRGPICGTFGVAAAWPRSLEDLLTFTPRWLEARREVSTSAYDGLILRLTESGLKLGSSGSDGAIIKLKPRATADLLVVGHFPGKGKYEGLLGGLIVSLDGHPEGPQCAVGSGFSDTMRDSAGEGFVGKIIEVAYLELTAAKKLREPSFIGFRTDKLKPDNLMEKP